MTWVIFIFCLAYFGFVFLSWKLDWQGVVKVVPTIFVGIMLIISAVGLITGQTYNEMIAHIEGWNKK
ncbi:hypothetical protein [Xylocopilactobacillus apicola]|uniref:hypothetical protein n=1 Tax=Xylocopilactobacillus apicola TaxID=2932184 RepID=UPI00295581B6|nr:hypothetical protein [Xylocopilactobacillus apicola]